MWELTFMGALVLIGIAAGYSFRAAWEPRLTKDWLTAVVSEANGGPVTWDDNDAAFFRQVFGDALTEGNVSALTAGDVRQIVLAALDEHRDKAVARVSRRVAKRGRKAVRS